MSQSNLRKSSTQCEVIMAQTWDRITIDFNPDCCRVVDQANYIKAECFSPKGNQKFRVRIEIESVSDDEVSRPQEKIKQSAETIGYDPNCNDCKFGYSHSQHFYLAPIEKGNTYKEIEQAKDYLSCDHVWQNSSEGLPYCSKCGNVKLTRKMNASSG